MLLKNVLYEDFVNYKEPSMFLAFPNCTFKCDKENGSQLCQNWSLTLAPIIDIDINKLIDNFLDNPITKAVVCGGLEPIDSFDELYEFIIKLREKSDAMVVIYTGYNPGEIRSEINKLKKIPNIIVKYGRYRPNEEKHFDPVLGVELASDNQYAKQIS